MHSNFKLRVACLWQPSHLGSYYNFDSACESFNRNAYLVLEHLAPPTECVRQRLKTPLDKFSRVILELFFITIFFLKYILIGVAKVFYAQLIKVRHCLTKKLVSFVSQVRKATSFAISTGCSKHLKRDRRRGRVAKRKIKDVRLLTKSIDLNTIFTTT